MRYGCAMRTQQAFVNMVQTFLKSPVSGKPNIQHIMEWQEVNGRTLVLIIERSPNAFDLQMVGLTDLINRTHPDISKIPDYKHCLKLVESHDPANGFMLCAKGADGLSFTTWVDVKRKS